MSTVQLNSDLGGAQIVYCANVLATYVSSKELSVYIQNTNFGYDSKVFVSTESYDPVGIKVSRVRANHIGNNTICVRLFGNNFTSDENMKISLLVIN